MAVRIFITGGTFDKEYNEITGQLYFKDTHMLELLEKGRCKVQVEIRTLMMVDSLEMTDGDRSLIAHQCQSCEETQIVVTHGTDTMTETAKVLAAEVPGKTICLTGALSPARFAETDENFTLGMAFATTQVAAPGVYIAMSGQVFDGLKVRKDRAAGKFVAL